MLVAVFYVAVVVAAVLVIGLSSLGDFKSGDAHSTENVPARRLSANVPAELES
jgi:hypothetical protein